MNKFDECTQKYEKLPYMNRARALYMRDFIKRSDISNILEIGFFHGKSSAYFAAILEDQGSGHLTTIDMNNAKNRNPNIFDVIQSLNLSHRVTPLFAQRSHTWELAKLIQMNPRPQFDFCYFDGGHTWDVTGFGFLLVDMLLKPGAWIAFDDMDWTISKSIIHNLDIRPKLEETYKNYSLDEKESTGVRMVYELIGPHLNYTNFFEEKKFGWGFAQKQK